MKIVYKIVCIIGFGAACFTPHAQAQYGQQAQSNTGPKIPPEITWNNNSQHNMDGRQLKSYALEFSKIDRSGPKGSLLIDNLASRVETFHQLLFTRNYNAMDILKNTEDLQKRISQDPLQTPAIKKTEDTSSPFSTFFHLNTPPAASSQQATIPTPLLPTPPQSPSLKPRLNPPPSSPLLQTVTQPASPPNNSVPTQLSPNN